MTWQLDPEPTLDGYAIEWLEPGRVFLSRRNRIYRAETPTGPRKLVGEIPAPLWKSWATRVRLVQRLFRFMVYNVLPLGEDEIFVTFGRAIGVLSGGKYRDVEGVARPCRVLRGGCAVTADSTVIWGEYVPNKDQGPIRIYGLRAGSGRAEVLHVFEPGQVRHVHGVFRDPHDESLWSVTGDLPSACRILRTRDEFGTLEVVGMGDETWRAVSLLFTPTSVFFASDAEFRTNHVYRLDRKSGRRTNLGEIDGPVYYTYRWGEDLFFATTAELCPSQERPVASLWHTAPGVDLHRIASFTKDLLHHQLTGALFMNGTLHFPAGPGLPWETYISSVGLRGLDNRSVRLHRS